MVNEFISPNWHPILIHFPIALAVTGVLVEILTLARPCGPFRVAGRWMMLLGSLLAIPALIAGIYAFRDVVVGDHGGSTWQQIAENSRWLPAQWDLMHNHIWLASIATAIFVLVTLMYLGGCDGWRRKAYWPMLLAMLVGVGLAVAAAWHGGELVYRYATGVQGPASAGATQVVDDHAPTGLAIAGHDITYYLPPLQLHMVLAGFAVAFVVAAFGLMMRRWYLDSLTPAPRRLAGEPIAPGVLPEITPVTSQERAELRSASGYNQPLPGPAPLVQVYPGWFWLGTLVLLLCTAIAGAWLVMGVFTEQTLKENWNELYHADERRLLVHVILGVSLITLSLVLAFLVRFARRTRWLAGLVGVTVLLLVAAQIWLGVLLTYDGSDGPLVGFVSTAQVSAPQDPPPSPRILTAPADSGVAPRPLPPPADVPVQLLNAPPPSPAPIADTPAASHPASVQPPGMQQEPPATAPYEEIGQKPSGTRHEDVASVSAPSPAAPSSSPEPRP